LLRNITLRRTGFNVEEAAQGTNEVSGGIGAVSRTANETRAAAEKALASAEELNEQAAMVADEPHLNSTPNFTFCDRRMVARIRPDASNATAHFRLSAITRAKARPATAP
jgi:hypothetical protein